MNTHIYELEKVPVNYTARNPPWQENAQTPQRSISTAPTDNALYCILCLKYMYIYNTTAFKMIPYLLRQNFINVRKENFKEATDTTDKTP